MRQNELSRTLKKGRKKKHVGGETLISHNYQLAHNYKGGTGEFNDCRD